MTTEIEKNETPERLDLPIEGMTCASCARRVEGRLNDLEGVTARVNFATEKATVDFDPEIARPEQLVDAVKSAGYKATLPGPARAGGSSSGRGRGRGVGAADAAGHDAGAGHPGPADADSHDSHSGHVHETGPPGPLRERLLITGALTLPVLLLSMIPPLQFDNWQWLTLTLAAPVVTWGAMPFHRATWANLKHGAATMDTLISAGVLAAFGWSLYALFFGDAGMPGMRMSFDLIPDAAGGSDHLYLEVAAAVTFFMLAGRYLEARAKGSAREALTALLELGAKEVTVVDEDAPGGERRIPIEDLHPGDLFVVRPGEKVATDGVVEEGASRARPGRRGRRGDD